MLFFLNTRLIFFFIYFRESIKCIRISAKNSLSKWLIKIYPTSEENYKYLQRYCESNFAYLNIKTAFKDVNSWLWCVRRHQFVCLTYTLGLCPGLRVVLHFSMPFHVTVHVHDLPLLHPGTLDCRIKLVYFLLDAK